MDARQHILEQLVKKAGSGVKLEDIVESPVADYGSPVAFKLAKSRGENPVKIAVELAASIQPTSLIARVEAVNGYVNFHLDRAEYTRQFLGEFKGADYGRGSKKERIILEHTSVNPTGPVHVGRLRNSIIGDSLRRILVYAGYDVETHYYVNDIGRQIAIIALGIEEGIMPSSEVESEYPKYMGKKDFQMFAVYVPSFARFEEDGDFKARVQELIRRAESGDSSSLEKITNAAKDCLEGQLESYSRMGISFNVFDYESDSIRDGSAFKVIGLAKASEHWVEEDFGSGLDLSSFGVEKKSGISVLARSDGTTVYLTRDLAYHLAKEKIAGPKGRIINVLGEDHKLEFRELKAILEGILGFTGRLEPVHYSFVSFEGEKFSTRKGRIASIDVLLDEAVEKALQEVRKREIADESIAPLVGVGAVKFHIVKTQPNKQITFRWGEALDFEGETAPYIQYAHARSCRMLEKAGEYDRENYSIDIEVDEEWALVKRLSSFPESVEKSAVELRPDVLATYLLALTSEYGRFYMKCPVLDSADDVKSRRLLLVESVRDVVKAGLGLLGIDAPERM
ncbi:MAG: arginine--tRNA ligase [Candidatus Altiarchaeota archaeon]